MAEQERTGKIETSGPHVETVSNDHAVAAVAAAPRSPTANAAAADKDGAPAAAPEHAAAHPPKPSLRRIIGGAIALAVLAAAVYFGVPVINRALNTVSTDDAYVNGHVTFVAARVPGQVLEVLVDDNYRVKKGQVIVRLDPKPYEVIVEQKKAAYDVAKADFVVAEDDVRAMIGKARSARFKLEHAVEDVNNQVALLHANVAKLNRADADYKRAQSLQKQPGVISQQEVDQYKESYRVALQNVYQVRVGLGLKDIPTSGDLNEVPENLNQIFSTVREALADLIQSAAPLGITASSYDLTPVQVIEEFYQRDPSGKKNVDVIYKKIIADAPTIKLAQVKVDEAKADLDQAELNLSYCTVYAEIDGVVTSRNVNPGNNVTAGQQLMAVRSLTEIWIDANYKETQLANLRIGQPVDLDVDMYGSHKMFKGHITGFTMGTGSTLALLPAENATGNFVKIVQRLPVRIELDKESYHSDKDPLFIGLSVTPYVYYKETPTGPNAGKFLQQLAVEAAEQKLLPAAGAPKASGEPATKFPPNDSDMRDSGARNTGTGAKPEKKQ
jgi:membrane fusion protein (multidrug efflux system)